WQHLAEQRHDAVEPDAVERREQPAWSRDLEHSKSSVGTQDAAQLTECAFDVVDVANSETDGCTVKGRVVERQRQEIAANPLQRGRLAPRTLQHRLREVESGHSSSDTGTGDRQIACPAARVEDAIPGPYGHLGSATPP